MGLSGDPEAETKLTQLQGSITRAPLQTETGIYSRKKIGVGGTEQSEDKADPKRCHLSVS